MKKILIICICYCFTLSNSLASSVKVHLSDLEEFSGLSKAVIMQKRQIAVETSPLFDLFGNTYTPNDEVFQIQDKAPWISAYELSCYGINGSQHISKGLLEKASEY